jgi:hypothetical protein
MTQCFEFRYHYFLQLKKDVIDGRMSCDAKQAVLLASYSMQGKIKAYLFCCVNSGMKIVKHMYL